MQGYCTRRETVTSTGVGSVAGVYNEFMEISRWKVFENWDGGNCCHLCLIIDLTQKKCKPIFMRIVLQLEARYLLKVGSFPPTKARRY